MKNARARHENETFASMLGPVWKAVAAAAIVTIALILLFALTLKLGVLKESSIPVVNQIIKILGILFAAFLATRKGGERRVLRAGIAGIVYILVGIIVFSLLDGQFAFSVSLVWDVVMGALVGLLAGLLFSKAGARR